MGYIYISSGKLTACDKKQPCSMGKSKHYMLVTNGKLTGCDMENGHRKRWIPMKNGDFPVRDINV